MVSVQQSGKDRRPLAGRLEASECGSDASQAQVGANWECEHCVLCASVAAAAGADARQGLDY